LTLSFYIKNWLRHRLADLLCCCFFSLLHNQAAQSVKLSATRDWRFYLIFFSCFSVIRNYLAYLLPNFWFRVTSVFNVVTGLSELSRIALLSIP